MRPDLIALQETIVGGGDDLVAEILDPGYRGGHQSDRPEDGHGVSLASRWPVEMLDEVNPPSHAVHRGLSVYDARGPCRAAGADRHRHLRHHFPIWPAHEYERSFRRSPRRGPRVHPVQPLVAGHDLPYRPLDYILVRCGDYGGPALASSDCRLTFARPVDGVWATDHFGVLADLAIRLD